MKIALIVTGSILGGLLGLWLFADWQSRQFALELRESDLNEVASWGLSAMCDSENQRALWARKTGSDFGGQSSVELGAIIWEIAADNRVPWSDDRINGAWAGPTRTVQRMLDTDSREEFYILGGELETWCDEHWDVLFDERDGVLPYKR